MTSPFLFAPTDIPGENDLEAARFAVGEFVGAGLIPWPDPRQEQPWQATRALNLLTDTSWDMQPYGPRLISGTSTLSQLVRQQAWEQVEALVLALALDGERGKNAPSVLLSCWGPITLAASAFHASGSRLVGDAGALRFIAQSLAEGFRALRDDLLSRHGLEVQLGLLEPELWNVHEGAVPTASGFSCHKPVDLSEIGEMYSLMGSVLSGPEQKSSLGQGRQGLLVASVNSPKRLGVLLGLAQQAGLGAVQTRLASSLDERFLELLWHGSDQGIVTAYEGADVAKLHGLLRKLGAGDQERSFLALGIGPGLRSQGQSARKVISSVLFQAQELRNS